MFFVLGVGVQDPADGPWWDPWLESSEGHVVWCKAGPEIAKNGAHRYWTLHDVQRLNLLPWLIQ